jgi:hypothetical protein
MDGTKTEATVCTKCQEITKAERVLEDLQIQT